MMKLLLVLCAATLLTACSKTPMEKLQSDTPYPDLNEKFWITQFNDREKNPLWREALGYCMENGYKPNCAPVGKVFMCGGDCLRKAPPIGHSGESVHFEG